MVVSIVLLGGWELPNFMFYLFNSDFALININ
jgi:hypothetical protein